MKISSPATVPGLATIMLMNASTPAGDKQAEPRKQEKSQPAPAANAGSNSQASNRTLSRRQHTQKGRNAPANRPPKQAPPAKGKAVLRNRQQAQPHKTRAAQSRPQQCDSQQRQRERSATGPQKTAQRRNALNSLHNLLHQPTVNRPAAATRIAIPPQGPTAAAHDKASAASAGSLRRLSTTT